MPALDELANHELIAILRNGQRTLASLHGHEAIAGLLIPSSGATSVTGASLALSAVAQAHAEGVSMAELVEQHPVVLALLAPRIGDRNGTDELGMFAGPVPAPSGSTTIPRPGRGRPRGAAPTGALAAGADGPYGVGARPSARRRQGAPSRMVRHLTLDELAHAAQLRTLPVDLDTRREPTGTSLPSRFRLDGRRARRGRSPPRPAVVVGGRGANAAAGVSTGTATGPIIMWHNRTRSAETVGAVLVVGHLDPLSPPSSRGWARSSPRRAAR